LKKTSKTIFSVFVAIATVVFAGLIFLLLPLVSGIDQLIMIVTVTATYIVVMILLYQIYQNYLKPTDQIKIVLQELIKGNYSARAYEKNHYRTDGVGYAVNELAFNLQNLNRQDKMHSRQLRTVIESMESGIMLLDTKGYVQLVNRKFTDLFDKTADEVKGKLYYQALNQEKIHKAVQDVFLYEEKLKDSVVLKKDDYTYHLEIVAVPFFNENKGIRGFVFVFHDITELKKVEQIRKDFVANVSHELKTPITSIKGFAETMLDDELADPKITRQFLGIIYKESDRLQALIHDLLELTNLEREEFDLELRQVNLSKLIEDSLAVVRGQANKKTIEITTHVNDDLTILGDESRLMQVILNLLYNAITYTKDEGKIKVTAKKNKRSIEIAVADNGIGIPQNMIDRIFERFYRVDLGRSRDMGGTGLGLAIVKHIVEAHEGSIEVDSQLGVGSTFRVYLPIKYKLN